MLCSDDGENCEDKKRKEPCGLTKMEAFKMTTRVAVHQLIEQLIR